MRGLCKMRLFMGMCLGWSSLLLNNHMSDPYSWCWHCNETFCYPLVVSYNTNNVPVLYWPTSDRLTPNDIQPVQHPHWRCRHNFISELVSSKVESRHCVQSIIIWHKLYHINLNQKSWSSSNRQSSNGSECDCDRHICICLMGSDSEVETCEKSYLGWTSLRIFVAGSILLQFGHNMLQK